MDVFFIGQSTIYWWFSIAMFDCWRVVAHCACPCLCAKHRGGSLLGNIATIERNPMIMAPVSVVLWTVYMKTRETMNHQTDPFSWSICLRNSISTIFVGRIDLVLFLRTSGSYHPKSRNSEFWEHISLWQSELFRTRPDSTWNNETQFDILESTPYFGWWNRSFAVVCLR